MLVYHSANLRSNGKAMNDNPCNDGPREAVKTYIEQTKLLVSLSSAFILAPAATLPFIGNTGTVPLYSRFLFLVWGEICFIASVLAGYVVLGTIAGSQHMNSFNVFRPATKWVSRFQILSYVAGLGLFLVFLLNVIRLQEARPLAPALERPCPAESPKRSQPSSPKTGS
jgi:hypothetical protein